MKSCMGHARRAHTRSNKISLCVRASVLIEDTLSSLHSALFGAVWRSRFADCVIVLWRLAGCCKDRCDRASARLTIHSRAVSAGYSEHIRVYQRVCSAGWVQWMSLLSCSFAFSAASLSWAALAGAAALSAARLSSPALALQRKHKSPRHHHHVFPTQRTINATEARNSSTMRALLANAGNFDESAIIYSHNAVGVNPPYDAKVIQRHHIPAPAEHPPAPRILHQHLLQNEAEYQRPPAVRAPEQSAEA